MANNYRYTEANAMKAFITPLNTEHPDLLFDIIVSEEADGHNTKYTNKLMAGDMTFKEAAQQYLGRLHD